MKIVYLANVRIPSERAHSTQIVHMCQAFAQTGNSVTLLANQRVSTGINKIREVYKITPKFELRRLSHGFLVLGWKWTFYLSELIFSLTALKYLKLEDFSIVYTRNEWTAWFLSFSAQVRDRLVWESHEAKLNWPARRLLAKKIKVVVISDGIKQTYVNHGVDPGLLLVAHDGIDESFFESKILKTEARKRLGISEDEKVAMYIGSLESWKGVETYCQAAKKVPTHSFYVIGGATEQINLMKLKYAEVRFLGAKPYHKLADNQQAADVLVIPNTATTPLSASYTSPLKLFAHMTAGVPLVVSNVPSITSVTGTELVSTFEPDNPDSLASTLDSVAKHYQSKITKAEKLKNQSKRFLWTERAKAIVTFASPSL